MRRTNELGRECKKEKGRKDRNIREKERERRRRRERKREEGRKRRKQLHFHLTTNRKQNFFFCEPFFLFSFFLSLHGSFES